jgi:hypothetical protein
MSYTVTFTNGKIYATIAPGTVDTGLGLNLIGASYSNYGQLLANNFVRLLEHHANSVPPVNPVAGQLWWNTATQVLSFYDGNKFKPCSSSELGSVPPLNPLDGDQWWDTTNNQLRIWNNDIWMLIGPGYIKGQGYSDLTTSVTYSTDDIAHVISTLTLNDTKVAVISNDTYDLAAPINGIVHVRPGINLAANTYLNGTAINSTMLGNIAASNFVNTVSSNQYMNGSLNAQTSLSVGNVMTIGPTTITSSSVTLASNISLLTVGNTITVNQEPTVASSVTTKNYVDNLNSTLSANAKMYTDSSITNLVNGAHLNTLKLLSTSLGNDASFALNTAASLSFKANVQNPIFSGPVTTNGHILPYINDTFDIGSTGMKFRHIYSSAISSAFADLAERYESDHNYQPGTVVIFGGDREITVSTQLCDPRVAGVISTDPGYLMNVESTGLAVALTGKVPCFVVGPVQKGSLLVQSSVKGIAQALIPSDWVPGCVIGKSLVDDSSHGIKTIMIAVGRD